MKRVYLFILVVHIVSCNEREKPISIEENIKIDSVNTLLEVILFALAIQIFTQNGLFHL